MRYFGIFFVFIFSLLFVGSIDAQQIVNDKVYNAFLNQKEVDVLIHFNDRPSLEGAKYLQKKEEKAQYVFNLLQKNQKAHLGLTQYLANRKNAYNYYWITNSAIVYNVNAKQIAQIKLLPNIESISLESSVKLDLMTSANTASLKADSVFTWGLEYMNVPKVWAQGISGQQVIIAGQDTGYDWTHPAIKKKYRGYINADSAVHDYNWHDAIHEKSPLASNDNNPCGFNSKVPCDDNNHGTHTMGTMVGTYDSLQLGVAPSAKWIACRNMERGNGQFSTYMECFQWFLAPTDLNGENPDPSKAPHVIANSWYCSEDEGCDSTSVKPFTDAIAALRASGVVVVVSAGNAGREGCNSLPENIATIPGSFSIAAHDVNGNIANFSSRGHHSKPESGPDVAAPGVNVLSSVRNNRFAAFNGTSMAGPHAAGLVALIISANPSLAGQVDTIEAIIRRTATPTLPPVGDECSASPSAVPNPVFGHGTINAEKAVMEAINWGGVVNNKTPLQTDLIVFPNPTSNNIQVILDENAIGETIVIHDQLGRLIQSNIVSEKQMQIQTASLPSGNYYLSLIGKSSVTTTKFVKH